jgi:hypothetical protein
MADDIQKNAPVKEIFDELFSFLETLETQNVAIVRFLKEEESLRMKSSRLTSTGPQVQPA